MSIRKAKMIPTASSSGEDNNNTRQLGIMHMRKLFGEFVHSKETLVDKEKEFRIYNMLPLFIKMFDSCNPKEMIDKFPDVLQFCLHVSKLMVTEIKRRGSNQSTEAASKKIVEFLEIDENEETSNGWMLLTTINIMSTGDKSLIQIMTNVSIPSTLVKCLYLFFDLPDMSEEDENINKRKFTSKERRILLQKLFVQVLVRLCSHPYPADELARMDDLSLLFSAITSQCPPYNVIWRKSASEVLTTLSRHGLTNQVVDYLHNKGCMSLCVDNMQRSSQLQPLEVVEMVVSVFCFLKDSSEVSQILLDDFKSCQGYLFLVDFLIKLDQEDQKSPDTEAAIRNLVLMTASLCICGYNELKVTFNNNSLFQMQGFKMPQISARGTCVRNLHAFQVLQTVFLKSDNTSLCCIILDAVSSVYHSDNANYFILESQNTLCQFSDVIHLKSVPVRERFFGLLEFIVFQLNFVPCKELISLSLLLKSNHSIDCSILCMKTLLNLLKHSNLFCDVYREVGVLEVFVNCLKKYKSLLENVPSEINSNSIKDPNLVLGEMILDALIILLSGNNSNATVFRDSGGSKCIHDMVRFECCNNSVLKIIKEMMVNTGGDDDMLRLLEAMQVAPTQQTPLKITILRSLVSCLRDSHRTRTIFRKVNGFSHLIKTIESLKGVFTDKADGNQYQMLLQLLYVVCQALTTAMRFEPANAKIFQQELSTSSFCNALRGLGCFSPTSVLRKETRVHFKPSQEGSKNFNQIFAQNIVDSSVALQEPLSLSFACFVFRILYNISLDNFDGPNAINASTLANLSEPSTRPDHSDDVGSMTSIKGPTLNLGVSNAEPIIVHPGTVLCMLLLLPSVENNQHEELGIVLEYFLAEVLKSLVRSERNQQILCEVGMAGVLLKVCRVALLDEQHILHLPLQYIFERLAVQALLPKEFREFLRLDFPMEGSSTDNQAANSNVASIPLTRIKTLVSMTTPRDFRAHGSYTLPPFVEMDMSSEGFGSIFLPSLAPQATTTTTTTNTLEVDGQSIGGIGTGDRHFPPSGGLSFSTWFCVEKFSDSRVDPHGIRLLTLIRTVNKPREENYVCLSILLSAKDKAIITSTQEIHMEQNVAEWEPDCLEDYSARVWCPDLLVEGQWHHLVVVLNKAVGKSTSFSLFIDGHHMHTQKIQYISLYPGSHYTSSSNPASSVFAYIGTPPIWRRYSRLCWKQGVCHLIEDVFNQSTVSKIYALGPHYLGSLQAPHAEKILDDSVSPIVPEERVIFGMNARAVSNLTLSKIRKVYSRVDCKAIAKQLGMNSHDNATPIKILHNSAGHLAGPARTLGGVMIGYLGIRCFSPNPVSAIIYTVGGCSVLLGIIAMSQNVESLYAGVKALTCVIKSNKSTQNEMDRKRYYQTLGMIFKKKKHLLNSHILHLTFNLVGTVNSGQETSAIPNVMSFQDLLCDFEIWLGAPSDILKSLLEHLLELISESSEKRTNIRIMRDMQCISKLLHIVEDVYDHNTREVLFCLLEILLGPQPRISDLLLFGQSLVYHIPQPGDENDKSINLADYTTDGNTSIHDPDLYKNNAIIRNMVLRNKGLCMLHSMLFTSKNTVNAVLSEEISKVLGLDWLMMFMQPHLNCTTVIWAMRILVVLCANDTIIGRFREGSMNSGYMKNTEVVSQNKDMLLLSSTQSVTASTNLKKPQDLVTSTLVKPSDESKSQFMNCSGFTYLEWLLQHHISIPEIYFLLTAIIMGQPVKLLGTEHINLDLDRIWTFLWGAPASGMLSGTSTSKISLCPEAVCILLNIIRKIVQTSNNAQWLHNHPITLVQVLFSLYHNLPDFMPVVMSAEVTTSLVSIMFPYRIKATDSESNSFSSPSGELVSYQELEKRIVDKKDQKLIEHPVRKFIIDFLRVIAVDSLSLAYSGKCTPVVDYILDAHPENSSYDARCEFLTEIITTLMDHLLAADILVGEQAALPIVPLLHSHVQNIAPNVFYLTARIVDKLWQRSLNKNPHEIFEFIIKLITQARRRTSAISLDNLYHSLNRCILYLLSRPTDTVPDQMMVMEALHKLTTNRLIIFGAGNHELEFTGCLTFCLLQLTANDRIPLDVTDTKEADRTTTWHINPTNDSNDVKDNSLNHHQGTNLIGNAALRVWEELYVCKKPAIEEVFKISLTPPINNTKAPDMTITREQILESAKKLWFIYIDGEKRAQDRIPWELHNNIQSKIQKVTGNLTRLASRTKVKKDDQNKGKSEIDTETMYQLNLVKLCLVKDFWELRSSQQVHMAQHTQRYVYQEWLQSEAELFRERGLWGPKGTINFTKWTLDTTEGPNRMRKKMMKNDLFYIHYPYRPELELSDQASRQLKYKVATSFDSRKYYHSIEKSPKVLSLQMEQESGAKPIPIDSCQSNLENKINDNEQGDDMDDDDEELSATPDNQTLLRLLEEKEKISHIFRCARIQGLDTFEGLLLFGREHCYIIDGFTLMKNREIRDIDSVPSGSYEPILPNSGNGTISHELRQNSKFAYEEIREVHKRRYLLQPIALEVFSGDGRNFLLSFPRKVRNKVYQRLMSVATSISDNAQQSVAGQSRSANVEQSSGIFSSLIGETSVTQRWVRGEISNFQYLMHLNTLAGRSYNDLMQYPVFPWILADYDSERLDMTNPKSFRDFSKPMGAQSKNRVEQFEKRFKEWDDPHGETPPYFYGTHYSSAMIVCSYLVRLEPFTQHFLRLQGGHFDLADRMFHSIKEAWHSASQHNMADVKELIPEFFYLPEFLINDNNFDFGVKQNGDILNHIVLPPWAKNDPREFIRIHRDALESDYVSRNLNLWIDLIFGYKQRGQAAVDAFNVFHHLFYEGNVDIYNIEDPLKKNATIGFINNFGQIPKQLFRKAHPAKRTQTSKNNLLDSSLVPPANNTTKLFFHNLENLKPSSQAIKEVKGPVGHIIQVEKIVLAVEQNKMLIPPNFNRYIAWGYADHSIRVGIYDSDRALFVCENVAPDSGEILACVCPNSKTIIMAGTNSILTVCDIDFKQKQLHVKHTLHGHFDAVTSLAASSAYNIIVSGSKDKSAIIWDMSRYKYVRQLLNHVGVVAAVSINELTGDIATCSATWLYVWSINGDCLAKVNTSIGCADRMQQILCVTFSHKNEWDNDNVIITGSTDGVVRMWSLDHVQIPTERQSCSDSHLYEEECDENRSADGESSSFVDIARKANSHFSDHPLLSLINKHSSLHIITPLCNLSGAVVRSSSTSSIYEQYTLHDSSQHSVINLEDSHNTPIKSTNKISSNVKAVSIDRHLDKYDSMINEQSAGNEDSQKSKKSFRWHRQLIFRTKLSMHTAYDLKGNVEPASITSLAISKDHRTVFVGDARGRIFSWSVADQPGKVLSDNWMKPGVSDRCNGCHVRFSRYESKNVCRSCGKEFCSKCCHLDSTIFQLRIRTSVRTCKVCHSRLQDINDT